MNRLDGRTVVVLGAAGFIGSHLCDLLIDSGATVVGVDNLITGRLANVEHLAYHPGFTLLVNDIAEHVSVDGAVDYVAHLASPASPLDYMKYPVETMRAGSRGTEHALDLARQKGARFMLASTSEVYGDPLQHPQAEDYWGNVNPVGPRSVYDEAKRFSEALTMAYHREYGLDVGIARIFNTYGPRMRIDDGRAVPEFFRAAIEGRPIPIHGDGTQTRSPAYVDDLVRGLALLLVSKERDPVNLGNPHEVTMNELAAAIVKVAGAEVDVVYEPRPVDDPSRRLPDTTRAAEVLGWKPEVDLETGLERTYPYFVAQLAEVEE